MHRPVTQSNKVIQNIRNDDYSNQIGSNTNNSATTMLTVTEINHQQSQSTLNSPTNNQLPSTKHFQDNLYDTEGN